MLAVVSRAWLDADVFGRARTPASSGIGALLTAGALYLWGSDTAASDYAVSLLAGSLGGFVIWAFLSFLWNLYWAPVRLANERAAAAEKGEADAKTALAAREAADTEAKRILRDRLRVGNELRQSIARAVGPTVSAAQFTTHVDNWIATAEVELRNLAPEWVAYFVTDTGDMPSTGITADTGEWMKQLRRESDAVIARLDRHLERLREIAYRCL